MSESFRAPASGGRVATAIVASVLALVAAPGTCAEAGGSRGSPTTTGAPAKPKPHDPPPQAYADCARRKAGEAVRHKTPEGAVDATCEDSPKGLVARPIKPPAPRG